MSLGLRHARSFIVNLFRLRRIWHAIINFWTTLIWSDWSRAASAQAFYVVAHQDDWQLFMNPTTYRDVRNPENEKVVFIYVTAGDAGLGQNGLDARVPYYLARESAAKAAVRFLADIDTVAEEGTSAMIVIEGHLLHRFGYKKTVSYFLRLPDGGIDGNGFPMTGNWSLEQFRRGTVHAASAVDNSTSYASWEELVHTVQQIIGYEMTRSTNVWVNIPDSDARRNPGSHPDHVSTSLLAQDALMTTDCVNRALFADYVTMRKAINLPPEDQHIQAAVFAVTVNELVRLGYPSIWEPLHLSWLGRQYLRVESPQSTNPQ